MGKISSIKEQVVRQQVLKEVSDLVFNEIIPTQFEQLKKNCPDLQQQVQKGQLLLNNKKQDDFNLSTFNIKHYQKNILKVSLSLKKSDWVGLFEPKPTPPYTIRFQLPYQPQLEKKSEFVLSVLYHEVQHFFEKLQFIYQRYYSYFNKESYQKTVMSMQNDIWSGEIKIEGFRFVQVIEQPHTYLWQWISQCINKHFGKQLIFSMQKQEEIQQHKVGELQPLYNTISQNSFLYQVQFENRRYLEEENRVYQQMQYQKDQSQLRGIIDVIVRKYKTPFVQIIPLPQQIEILFKNQDLTLRYQTSRSQTFVTYFIDSLKDFQKENNQFKVIYDIFKETFSGKQKYQIYLKNISYDDKQIQQEIVEPDSSQIQKLQKTLELPDEKQVEQLQKYIKQQLEIVKTYYQKEVQKDIGKYNDMILELILQGQIDSSTGQQDWNSDLKLFVHLSDIKTFEKLSDRKFVMEQFRNMKMEQYQNQLKKNIDSIFIQDIFIEDPNIIQSFDKLFNQLNVQNNQIIPVDKSILKVLKEGLGSRIDKILKEQIKKDKQLQKSTLQFGKIVIYIYHPKD